MIRPRIALFVAAVLCLPASAQDNPKPKVEDPIAAELTKAKQEFQTAVEKAGEKLVAAFADQKKKLDENKKLKVEELIKLVEQLQAEEKAFVADATVLPKSPSLKSAVSDYQTSVVVARKKCESAFVKAAESYRDKKDLTAAKVVLAEKDSFLGSALAGPSRGDRFAVGSFWTGNITFTGERAGKLPFEMKVTERKNDAITVESVQYNNNKTTKKVEYKGTIKDGKIELKALRVLDKTPFFRGDYRGELKGESLKFTYKLEQGLTGIIELELKTEKSK